MYVFFDQLFYTPIIRSINRQEKNSFRTVEYDTQNSKSFSIFIDFFDFSFIIRICYVNCK